MPNIIIFDIIFGVIIKFYVVFLEMVTVVPEPDLEPEHNS